MLTKTLLYHHRRETIAHWQNTESSIHKVESLEKWAAYWDGKKKAEKCPAFQRTGRGWGECRAIESHELSGETNYESLFRRRCARCSLSPKKALEKATWNGVFRTKKD